MLAVRACARVVGRSRWGVGVRMEATAAAAVGRNTADDAAVDAFYDDIERETEVDAPTASVASARLRWLQGYTEATEETKYATLLHDLVDKNMLGHGQLVFDRISSLYPKRTQVETYNGALRLFEKQQNVPALMQTFDELTQDKSLAPDETTIATMLRGLSSIKHPRAMLDFWDANVKENAQFLASSAVHGAFIRGLGKCGRIPLAKQHLESLLLPDAPVKPELEFFDSIIDHCERYRGQAKHAFDVYEFLKSKTTIKPSQKLVHRMGKLAVRSGDRVRAKLVLDDIDRFNYRTPQYAKLTKLANVTTL